jgi:hypothetical protein
MKFTTIWIPIGFQKEIQNYFLFDVDLNCSVHFWKFDILIEQ